MAEAPRASVGGARRAVGERDIGDARDDVYGWDVGGAHLKACRVRRGRVVDAAQWACALWQGLDRLDGALTDARIRWPALANGCHAVTMTGELVDLFASRADGVARIAAHLARALTTPDDEHADKRSDAAVDAERDGRDPRGAVDSGGRRTRGVDDSAGRHAAADGGGARVRFYAGDAGWCAPGDVAAQWASIASANWLATARHAASAVGDGVLVDIGSTTTDLIAFRGGRVTTASRTDAARLACGELVYSGVVRTPLCALAARIDWRGTPHATMKEFFATTADVYRLNGELDPAHDLHPAADGAAKDLAATRRRLARMIGLDAADGTDDDWRRFAHAWRAAQVDEAALQLRRVVAASGLDGGVVVGAGCGDFLVADVLARTSEGWPEAAASRWRVIAYGRNVAGVEDIAGIRDVAGVEDIVGSDEVVGARELAEVAVVVGSTQVTEPVAARRAAVQICAPAVATALLYVRDCR